MRGTSKKTVEKARALRREMSPPEAALWRVLKTRPDGLKFRRQHPIGPYVVDFYRPHARLIIEIDGEVHERGDIPERDEKREEWLRGRGFRILRVPAYELSGDIEPAVRLILSHCRGDVG